MPTLGEAIQQRRRTAGLTLRELARRVEVSPPFITDIEAGRRHPSPEVLGRIAAVLDVDAGELESLSGKLRPDMRRWVESTPEVGRLLRRLRSSPHQGRVLRELERVLDDEQQSQG